MSDEKAAHYRYLRQIQVLGLATQERLRTRTIAVGEDFSALVESLYLVGAGVPVIVPTESAAAPLRTLNSSLPITVLPVSALPVNVNVPVPVDSPSPSPSACPSPDLGLTDPTARDAAAGAYRALAHVLSRADSSPLPNPAPPAPPTS
ncbi:MAG: hypothetical protein IPG50_00630 [Myxococcales bacterium]|nr:hypothetical protein [Myxococcales bacterium]